MSQILFRNLLLGSCRLQHLSGLISAVLLPSPTTCAHVATASSVSGIHPSIVLYQPLSTHCPSPSSSCCSYDQSLETQLMVEDLSGKNISSDELLCPTTYLDLKVVGIIPNKKTIRNNIQGLTVAWRRGTLQLLPVLELLSSDPSLENQQITWIRTQEIQEIF